MASISRINVNGQVYDVGKQGNWETNDSTDLTFIQNRTHYKEETSEGAFTASGNFTMSPISGRNEIYKVESDIINYSMGPIEHETYRITLDDSSFTIESEIYDGNIILGNPYLIDENYENNECEIALTFSDIGWNLYGLHSQTFSDIKVEKIHQIYHTIPLEYLPADIARTNEVVLTKEQILEEEEKNIVKSNIDASLVLVNKTGEEPSKMLNFNINYLTEEEYLTKKENGLLEQNAFYCTDFNKEAGESGGTTGGASLPEGGEAGQVLTKIDSSDGNAEWRDLPSLDYLPLDGGTVTGETIFSNTTDATSTATGAVRISGGLGVAKTVYANQVYGGVYNDYAEYRFCNDNVRAGQVICENGDDTTSLSSKRLQPGAMIVSDTFGFSIGDNGLFHFPIAVSGRVLAYVNPEESKEDFKAGAAVCAGPNGTISLMSREEIREYPEFIIGTVSAIPDYEYWGKNKIEVNGRIWIKVR